MYFYNVIFPLVGDGKEPIDQTHKFEADKYPEDEILAWVRAYEALGYKCLGPLTESTDDPRADKTALKLYVWDLVLGSFEGYEDGSGKGLDGSVSVVATTFVEAVVLLSIHGVPEVECNKILNGANDPCIYFINTGVYHCVPNFEDC